MFNVETRATQISKLTVTVTSFRPVHRGTLVGFCTAYISELRLTVYDIAVHQHASGAHWAQLPARPMVDRDGTIHRTSDGRIQYSLLLRFDKEVNEAFSKAVVAALLKFAPDAFSESAACVC